MANSDKDNIKRGAERRASERLTIDLPARIDLDGRDGRTARIMDYCVGGLFLTVEGQEDDYLVLAARQIGRDDRLRVTFEADPGDGMQAFTVPVKVARLFLGGMGVAFAPPQPAALRALHKVAERSRSAALARESMTPAPQGVDDADGLLAEVRQRVERELREGLGGVFKCASDELFTEARDATNNDLQAEAMDALKDVERVQSSVCDVATQRVLRSLGRLSAADSSALATVMDESDDRAGTGGGLSLVDTGSFDDWVTTKNIITRHEPELREAAYALARRLEILAGKHVDEMANPLGLQQLGSAFNEAMANTGLPQRPRRAIYSAFEHALVPALGKLHGQLNKTLIDKGILPIVERPLPGPARRSQAAPPRRPPDAPPDVEQTAAARAEMPAADAPYPQHENHGQQGPYPAGAGGQFIPGPEVDGARGLPGAAPGAAHPNAAHDSAAAPIDAAPSTPAMAAPHGYTFQPTYHSPIQSAVPQVGMDRAYQAARSLMGMRRAMASGAAVAGAEQALAATPAQQASGPSPSLLDALSLMQRSPEFNPSLEDSQFRRTSSGLKERLQNALRGNGATLSDEESEAVEVLGNLIEAVLGDPLIETNVKPRIQRLSVPLLRTAMQDQGFFEQDAHPARQVINRLSMLGLPDALASGQSGDSLQSVVDPILDRMLEDTKAGPEAFEAVLPELDGLIERQNERISSHLSSIVTAREQQQALLTQRRSRDTEVPRRVAPELEPWFQRTERLKVGDSMTFRVGSDKPQTRTLAWVADDHETFVFADRNGRESAAVAQQELALEMLRGTAKVADSLDVPAMDRGVYQMLHDIHRSLAAEGNRDSVTGTIPVSAFETRVEEAIARAQRRGSRHALLAMNLDGFATINERCGRAAGDSLLRKLSRLLERQVAEQGCVTRAFADEFLILLEDQPFQDARRFAERQCRAIENSRVVFEGEQYPITASIGMVPVTRAGESATSMIENARAALAGAKQRGGNQLRVFDPDEDELPARDARIPHRGGDHREEQGDGAADTDDHGAGRADVEDLVDLLSNGRIVLHRQLVSPLAEETEHKSHYEIVLGMRGAAGTLDAVSEDLLVASERSERRAEVDRWVIRTALQWMAANRRDVVRSGGYAINLSGAAFEDDSLLEYVVGELTESTIPPAKIIFSVPESAAIDPLSSAVSFIRAMRDYGCRFAIDDFGAGNATFAYLKTLPVDYVKIGGLFVREIADNDNDYAMVKSINEISHLMGKLTIASFADTDKTVKRLKELAVDFIQGDALGTREVLQ